MANRDLQVKTDRPNDLHYKPHRHVSISTPNHLTLESQGFSCTHDPGIALGRPANPVIPSLAVIAFMLTPSIPMGLLSGTVGRYFSQTSASLIYAHADATF